MIEDKNLNNEKVERWRNKAKSKSYSSLGFKKFLRYLISLPINDYDKAVLIEEVGYFGSFEITQKKLREIEVNTIVSLHLSKSKQGVKSDASKKSKVKRKWPKKRTKQRKKLQEKFEKLIYDFETCSNLDESINSIVKKLKTNELLKSLFLINYRYCKSLSFSGYKYYYINRHFDSEPFKLFNHGLSLKPDGIEERYLKLKRSIIRHLARSQINNEKRFLLISNIVDDKDREIIADENDLLLKWDSVEINDEAKWRSKEVKLMPSSAYSFKNITLNYIVKNYLDAGSLHEKDMFFWLLKWKVFKGVEESEKTKYNKLTEDSRFVTYFRDILDIGLTQDLKMEDIFTFPIIATNEKNEKEDQSSDCYFSSYSPLTHFGYKVGKHSPLSTDQRLKILATCFFSSDTIFQKYNWGIAGSSKRLKKMSFHIARMAKIRNNNNVYRVAVLEWAEDLVNLKREYYDQRMANEFMWPNVK